MPDLIALTGVTGALGGRVANLLADTANPLRFITRDPARSPPIDAEVRHGSYDDAEAMTAALKDVDVLLLVSAREDKDRLDHHRSALEAAAAAGVGKIVYTSFIGPRPIPPLPLGASTPPPKISSREPGSPSCSFATTSTPTSFPTSPAAMA